MGYHVKARTLMVMVMNQETHLVVIITFLVLVRGVGVWTGLMCPIGTSVGEAATDILTEMVAVIQVLGDDPADQAMKTTTLTMILYYG